VLPEFDLQVIETGDSVKVKQVFDEAIVDAVRESGYEQNFFWENIKLSLMFISCVFAMVAQFFPIPFPASRPLLGICCASYFILSVVLQYIISFIDKDTVMITNPVPVSSRILTMLPLFIFFYRYLLLEMNTEPGIIHAYSLIFRALSRAVCAYCAGAR
jgi:hypothetical protein